MDAGPFGRCAAAMITPFTDSGALDTDGARRLAAHLVDRGGCDALVLNGTTGEAQATSDEEKTALVQAVAAEAGDRAVLVAGVGSGSTRDTLALAAAARDAGAHGLLVGTPAFSRPPQEAIVHHLRTVADSTGLPVMLYDTPSRTGEGTALTAASLRELAAHPRIRGVKDCAFDLRKSASVLADTGLACYAGSDELNLPLLALGAAGCVSTVANVAGPQVRGVLDAYAAGENALAARRHRALLPLIEAMLYEVPGAVAVKALFAAAGLPGGTVRGPLLPAGEEVTARLADALKQSVAAG